MRRPALIDEPLAKLLREASARPMSDEARERQLVSLTYGNVKLENDEITRALVEDVVRHSRPKR